MRPWTAAGVLLVTGVIAGCGNSYRPVVTPITPTNPTPQPESLVAVISQPKSSPTATPTVEAVASIVDYSGDVVMASAGIQGVGPSAFTLDYSGTRGFTLNADKTISVFNVSKSLHQNDPTTQRITLESGAQPVNLLESDNGYIADTTGNQIDVVVNGAPLYTVPVANNPITVIGVPSALRVYAISQVTGPGTCDTPASVTVPGVVSSLQTSSFTVDSTFTVGTCPVYGVASSDGKRIFILNRGSSTISVINTDTNALTRTISLPSGSGPTTAVYVPTSNELVTSNYDGNSVSIIDASIDSYGNDTSTFGTVLATVPVGRHPRAVTVLADNSRAYTANYDDSTVSVINLSSLKNVKTIPVSAPPRTIASTSSSQYGKVYTVSDQSSYLSIIQTIDDTFLLNLQLPGYGVDVRTQYINASGTNYNYVTRSSGNGQP